MLSPTVKMIQKRSRTIERAQSWNGFVFRVTNGRYAGLFGYWSFSPTSIEFAACDSAARRETYGTSRPDGRARFGR